MSPLAAPPLFGPAPPRPRFGPPWTPQETLRLRQLAERWPGQFERIAQALIDEGFPPRRGGAISRKLWRLQQLPSPFAPRPPLSEAEHQLILAEARRGARPPQISAALTAAGFPRSRWTVYRHLRRLRATGVLAPPEPSPSPAKVGGRVRPWTEPPDKADREALIADRLRWLCQGLPPTGLALTLPGYQWARTLAALDGLADEILAVERDPAIYQALLEQLRHTHPTHTPVSLLHADFWAVAAAPPGPIRILDYDGMDAMRPDLLEALRRALAPLAPRALVRLTFETRHGAGLDAVLEVLAAHRPLEAVWHVPHQRGYPMVTALVRVGPPPPTVTPA